MSVVLLYCCCCGLCGWGCCYCCCREVTLCVCVRVDIRVFVDIKDDDLYICIDIFIIIILYGSWKFFRLCSDEIMCCAVHWVSQKCTIRYRGVTMTSSAVEIRRNNMKWRIIVSAAKRSKQRKAFLDERTNERSLAASAATQWRIFLLRGAVQI